MLAAGPFEDVDVLLGWRPSTDTRTKFEFQRKRWRSALSLQGRFASRALPSRPTKAEAPCHAVWN